MGRAAACPLRSPTVDEPTYRVSDLTSAVELALDVCFPDEIWVQGEISSLNRSAAGHVYFQLIEAGEPGGPPLAQIAVTLFASAKVAVNATLKRVGGMRMTDGVEIRLRGRLGVYGPQGRLQLRMTAIDPDYTLGRLAGDRERLVRALSAEGLIDRNATVPLPVSPVRIGLVTSRGSAAEADFLHELELSGLAWDVVAVDTRVQGSASERGVVAALDQLTRHRVEVIALVRGGGARTDLATFDREIVARAIAGLPVPVLTGIGHEVDRSVADEVAHRALKTPTACAAFLVARARTYHDRVDDTWGRIARRSTDQLDASARRLHTAASAAGRRGQITLTAADQHLAERARRVARAAPGTLDAAARHLDLTEARVGSLDPRRALARGWSITRTADGTLVREAKAVRPGDTLVTTFVDGIVVSTAAPTPASGRPPIEGQGAQPGGSPP